MAAFGDASREGETGRERGGEREREGPCFRVTTVRWFAAPRTAGGLIRLQLPQAPLIPRRGGHLLAPPARERERERDRYGSRGRFTLKTPAQCWKHYSINRHVAASTMYVYAYIYIYIYMISLSLSLYIYIYNYIVICVHMLHYCHYYLHVYYIYIYIYIHIHIHISIYIYIYI